MTDNDGFRSLSNHDYYLQGGDLFFLVEDYRFRVHRYFFERESRYFRRKLAAEPPQGTSDANAIILSNIAAEDFARLLWVFYNPKYSLYDATLEDWETILELAHRWEFYEVKKLTIRELEKFEIPPVHKISLYHYYNVDRTLLVPSYIALCSRLEPLDHEEGEALGLETVINVFTAREYARGYRTDDGTRQSVPANLPEEDMSEYLKTIFGVGKYIEDDFANSPGGSVLMAMASRCRPVVQTEVLASSLSPEALPPETPILRRPMVEPPTPMELLPPIKEHSGESRNDEEEDKWSAGAGDAITDTLSDDTQVDSVNADTRIPKDSVNPPTDHEPNDPEENAPDPVDVEPVAFVATVDKMNDPDISNSPVDDPWVMNSEHSWDDLDDLNDQDEPQVPADATHGANEGDPPLAVPDFLAPVEVIIIETSSQQGGDDIQPEAPLTDLVDVNAAIAADIPDIPDTEQPQAEATQPAPEPAHTLDTADGDIQQVVNEVQVPASTVLDNAADLAGAQQSNPSPEAQDVSFVYPTEEEDKLLHLVVNAGDLDHAGQTDDKFQESPSADATSVDPDATSPEPTTHDEALPCTDESNHAFLAGNSVEAAISDHLALTSNPEKTREGSDTPLNIDPTNETDGGQIQALDPDAGNDDPLTSDQHDPLPPPTDEQDNMTTVFPGSPVDSGTTDESPALELVAGDDETSTSAQNNTPPPDADGQDITTTFLSETDDDLDQQVGDTSGRENLTSSEDHTELPADLDGMDITTATIPPEHDDIPNNHLDEVAGETSTVAEGDFTIVNHDDQPEVIASSTDETPDSTQTVEPSDSQITPEPDQNQISIDEDFTIINNDVDSDVSANPDEHQAHQESSLQQDPANQTSGDSANGTDASSFGTQDAASQSESTDSTQNYLSGEQEAQSDEIQHEDMQTQRRHLREQLHLQIDVNVPPFGDGVGSPIEGEDEEDDNQTFYDSPEIPLIDVSNVS